MPQPPAIGRGPEPAGGRRYWIRRAVAAAFPGTTPPAGTGGSAASGTTHDIGSTDDTGTLQDATAPGTPEEAPNACTATFGQPVPARLTAATSTPPPTTTAPPTADAPGPSAAEPVPAPPEPASTTDGGRTEPAPGSAIPTAADPSTRRERTPPARLHPFRRSWPRGRSPTTRNRALTNPRTSSYRPTPRPARAVAAALNDGHTS